MTAVIPRLLLACGMLAWALTAGAERPVYKNVNAEGKVTYSDRRSATGDAPVRNWMPADQGRYAYDSAVLRAESDRVYYARLRAEHRQRVPVAIYDPRGWQQAQYPPVLTGGWPRRAFWDPNLPHSPAPSVERNYYYNGR